jgi:hypothetical protein
MQEPVVVIEGDESINPKLLKVFLSEDLPVQFVFACRDFSGFSESVEISTSKPYALAVYRSLKLSEILLSAQTSIGSAMADFVKALDAPRPRMDVALQALDIVLAAAAASRRALYEHGGQDTSIQRIEAPHFRPDPGVFASAG